MGTNEWEKQIKIGFVCPHSPDKTTVPADLGFRKVRLSAITRSSAGLPESAGESGMGF